MKRMPWVDLRTPMIAAGGRCMIFRHPADEAKIIKVTKATEHPGLRGYFKARKAKRQFRECSTLHTQAIKRFERQGRKVPIPRLFGTVATPLGTGLVMEAVLGEDRQLGTNLEQLMEHDTLEEHHRHEVNELARASIDCGVVVPDLQLANIVWGTARGRRSMFIVDGFDDHTHLRRFGWLSLYDRKKMLERWNQRILRPLMLDSPA